MNIAAYERFLEKTRVGVWNFHKWMVSDKEDFVAKLKVEDLGDPRVLRLARRLEGFLPYALVGVVWEFPLLHEQELNCSTWVGECRCNVEEHTWQAQS